MNRSTLPFSKYPGGANFNPPDTMTLTTKTTAGAVTYSVTEFFNGVVLRDPNGAARSDVTPTAKALLNAFQGMEAGDSFTFTVRNTADGAERITMTAGTGFTLVGRMVIDPGEEAHFVAVCTNVTFASGAFTLQRVATTQHVPTIIAVTADGAVSPSVQATYNVTKAGVAAMTLAAPTAVTHDGQIIRIFSATANAHTLTATNLLETGTANVSVATFAAQLGAGLTLMARNAKWVVLSSVGVTFS